MHNAIKFLVERVKRLDRYIGATWYKDENMLVFYWARLIIGKYKFKNSQEVYERLPEILKEIKKALIIIKCPSLAYGLEKTFQKSKMKLGFKKEQIIK
jgi:hypothetical protein